MENPSGSQQQEFIQTNQGSASSYNNGLIVTPSLEDSQGVSMDWTPQEQAILEEGLAHVLWEDYIKEFDPRKKVYGFSCGTQYASESVILRYAKIALLLKSKTVRDVALRCRWMRRQENSKKMRKEDFRPARKNKETKMTMDVNRQDHLLEHQHTAALMPNNSDNIIDLTVAPSFIAIQQGLASGVPGMITNKEAVGITGPIRHLLQQNAQAFNQISLNIATCQMHENIGLLSQTRDNIYKILNSLNDVPEMTQMPPLRIKVNEELASFILPPSALQMKR